MSPLEPQHGKVHCILCVLACFVKDFASTRKAFAFRSCNTAVTAETLLTEQPGVLQKGLYRRHFCLVLDMV